MNSNFVSQPNCKPQNCRGFALVVALSLMAFVLVLIVTLLSLMEVETRSADNSLELRKAREGARLALNMAFSKLQEYAGNDQRVTARADILGVDLGGKSRFKDVARYWTGVWRTDVSDTEWPKWLVSWHTSATEPDPSDLPADSVMMLLVGNGSGVADASHHVYAPKIDVMDKNGNVSSRIAWWISDEGVKASVAQLPLDERNNNPGFTLPASLDSLQTMLTTTQGLEEVLAGYNRFTSSQAANIDRITNIMHVFDADGLNLGWPSTSEDAFHSLTSMSLGLLSSTTGTGLMEDLSLFPDEVEASPDSQAELASYVSSAVDRSASKAGSTGGASLQRSIGLRELVSTPAAGDIFNVAAPVLTNFMMAFAIFESDTQTSGNTLLRMQFFCEFWNPYTSSLAMREDTGNPTLDALNLELRITGLPKVVVEALDGSGSYLGTGSEIDLQTILGDPSPGLTGNPVIIRLNYDQKEDWLPGMTKNWTGITGATGPQQYDSSQTVSSLDDTTQTTVKGDWDKPEYTLGGPTELSTGVVRASSPTVDASGNYNQIKVLTSNPAGASPAPGNTLAIEIYSHNTVTGKKDLLTRLDGATYNPIETLPPAPVNDTAMREGEMNFGFHFVLKGPSSSSSQYYRGDWLANGDPRSSIWATSYTPVINGTTPQVAPANPHDIKNGTIDISAPKRLFDRSDDSIDPPSNTYYKELWQDSPLFEVPRERILSIASLQHLHFYGERPFQVGNSWGDEGATDTLQWFDRYYFSGLSSGDNLGNFTQHSGFPNPLLTTYNYSGTLGPLAESRDLARNAMVTSRFNINSTSVEAWKAVLGGLRINDWPYLNYPNPKPYPSVLPPVNSYLSTAADDLRSALFARFSDSLHETYVVPITPETSGTLAPSEFYRRGGRYLSSGQIATLAQEVVNSVKTRVQNGGTPFLSMKDFLDNPSPTTGSVLEEAIQASVFTDGVSGRQQWDRSWETTGSVGDSSDRIDIDHFSPGFLTQADIMTAIGPMLAPRSDTFKIRARCQTLSPFDPNEVIGDATLEAVVQRTPEPLDPGDNIDSSIDRKFKIVSVRWLTADEI